MIGLIDGSSDTDEGDDDDDYDDDSKSSGKKGKKGRKSKNKKKSLLSKTVKGKLKESAENAKLAEKKAMEEELMNFEVRKSGLDEGLLTSLF